MAPTLAKQPPAGDGWLHELKVDGWRAQVHVLDGNVAIYSKRGADITRRFTNIHPVCQSIPAKSAILDCELVACDAKGMPCFRTLTTMGNRSRAICLVAFDLLYLNGVRLTPLELAERKAMLGAIVAMVGSKQLQFSAAFNDPLKLLASCEKLGFEGIVSKRADSVYLPGPTKDWLKVKTAAWRAANADRFEMMRKRS
jgi:bifunctional non-homologous end joining protein LigD